MKGIKTVSVEWAFVFRGSFICQMHSFHWYTYTRQNNLTLTAVQLRWSAFILNVWNLFFMLEWTVCIGINLMLGDLSLGVWIFKLLGKCGHQNVNALI